MQRHWRIGEGRYSIMCVDCVYGMHGFPNATVADGMANLHRDAMRHEVLVLGPVSEETSEMRNNSARTAVGGARGVALADGDVT